MLTSRYIQKDEFIGFCQHIDGTSSLIDVAQTLFDRGLVRGTFFGNKCYSLQGVYTLADRIGDAWMISDKELLKKFPLAAHRSARIVLDYAFKEFDFTRIQIQASGETDLKWCESIGFKKISSMGENTFLVMNR